MSWARIFAECRIRCRRMFVSGTKIARSHKTLRSSGVFEYQPGNVVFIEIRSTTPLRSINPLHSLDSEAGGRIADEFPRGRVAGLSVFKQHRPEGGGPWRGRRAFKHRHEHKLPVPAVSPTDQLAIREFDPVRLDVAPGNLAVGRN